MGRESEGSSQLLATSRCAGTKKEGPVGLPFFFVTFGVDNCRGKCSHQMTLSPYMSQCRFPFILGLVLHVVSWMMIFIKCLDLYCLLLLISLDSSVTVISTGPLIQTHAFTCHWGIAYWSYKFWLIKVHVATETLLLSKLFIFPLGQLTFRYFLTCLLFHF